MKINVANLEMFYSSRRTDGTILIGVYRVVL
jgi:hypothetical protein